MMLNIRSSLLLMLLSVLFFSCEKEYSLEGALGGGTAAYRFQGAPGACTNAVVTGSYEPGVALNATNLVTISVDVIAPGTYTVSTPAVNGITFSGAGTFDTSGVQTITLVGSGIPTEPGPFTFSPGTNGCAFAVTVSSGGGGSGGTATFSLDGAPAACAGAVPAGNYTAGTPLEATNFVEVGVTVTTAGTYIISTNAINGMVFTATGTFASAGQQRVQLQGSGTPLTSGDFTFIPGANGCSFIISVVPANAGTSVFTYVGGTGNCTNATVAGSFTAGAPVTAANIVTIDVNVSTIGTYIVSTPLVNGISFAGNGNFTTTGAQTVTLSATGTPNVAGVFNYAPTNNGCVFPVTVGAGVPATDFLRCTIDGVARTFNSDLQADTIVANAIVLGGFETGATDAPVFQLNLSKTPRVTTGTYQRFSATNTATFCIAGYFDGVSTTGWVTGVLQTGTFVVNVTQYSATRITGTFSGTLYDNDGAGTGTKVITLGEFSIPL